MEQPIACTLSPGQYKRRSEDLAALAARALRFREPTADGERLIFTAGEDTERALRAAIAAEASCCTFLRMELVRGGDELVLNIAGPPESRPIIAELFDGIS